MNTQTIGIIVGGLLPALLYGLTAVLTKASTKAGIGIGMYLILVGIACVLAGAGFFFLSPDRTVSMRSALYAFGVGLTWGIGTGLVAIGLTTYGIPIAKLTPLYNMNTLIAVLLALWIFAEWQEVRVTQLLIGSILIVIGGTLVARA